MMIMDVLFSFIQYIRYMIDRETAEQVDGAVQDGLFLMAVSNSCMNPLVYGSYAMKCRKPCRKPTMNGIGNIPTVLPRKSSGELLPSYTYSVFMKIIMNSLHDLYSVRWRSTFRSTHCKGS